MSTAELTARVARARPRRRGAGLRRRRRRDLAPARPRRRRDGLEARVQGFRQTSRLVVALILARLLSPADFGVAAEVIVFSSLVIVFADLAFGAALIQREEVTDDDCSTAFWACAATGLAFTLLGVALAGPIAHFYGEPQVKPLVMVLSATFLLTSVSTIQESLLARDLAFRTLETRLMAATVVGAVVGIGRRRWAGAPGP